ncbi:MAG: hypothetical protein ACYCUE_01560 [Steroidobacteraceae bacterium]
MPTSTDGKRGPRPGAEAGALAAAQRRKVRLTTWVVGLIALGFYVGFIILTVIRARR